MHFSCHLCINEVRYFSCFEELSKHFQSSHFSCMESGCLAKKFIVFETQIELESHTYTTHTAKVTIKSMAKQARPIPEPERAIKITSTPILFSSESSFSNTSSSAPSHIALLIDLSRIYTKQLLVTGFASLLLANSIS
eukprot:GHVP01018956.1.p1 GENE.GHVP01018956.1~~GHVP01018956.1.p1  ORF type:complete len:138 (-),score=4.86 GHVP01018956.1:1416-1829(-)